jgi:anti-anti-sigma factor
MSVPAVYAPQGRIDSSNSRQREKELMEALEQGGGSALLDFSKVEFLSSAGLRVLLLAANVADRQGGVIRVQGAIPSVREVLVVSGFDDILTLVD